MTSESTYEQDQGLHGTFTGSGADRVYISKAGESLEALAERFYGAYQESARLKADNPEWKDYHAGSSLPAGSRLRVPDPNAPAPEAQEAPAASAAQEAAAAVSAPANEEAAPPVESAGAGEEAPAAEAASATEEAPASDAGIESAPASREYTVVAGDSLSAIAQREYGDAGQWQRIFEANRDQIDNPDLIHPGQVLRIPA